MRVVHLQPLPVAPFWRYRGNAMSNVSCKSTRTKRQQDHKYGEFVRKVLGAVGRERTLGSDSHFLKR